MMGNSHTMLNAFKGFIFNMTKLSLGGTTGNVTPQSFVTHPTSKQHRIHIKKTFLSKLFIKRLPKSCRIQNSN
jgi:hypothetical protein